jgi:DNA-binding XRE family transcriptional regulator
MPTINRLKVRELREKRVLTQAELAHKAGVRAATVADIEGGKHQPRPSTIRKIAAALDVKPQDLF